MLSIFLVLWKLKQLIITDNPSQLFLAWKQSDLGRNYNNEFQPSKEHYPTKIPVLFLSCTNFLNSPKLLDIQETLIFLKIYRASMLKTELRFRHYLLEFYLYMRSYFRQIGQELKIPDATKRTALYKKTSQHITFQDKTTILWPLCTMTGRRHRFCIKIGITFSASVCF